MTDVHPESDNTEGGGMTMVSPEESRQLYSVLRTSNSTSSASYPITDEPPVSSTPQSSSSASHSLSPPHNSGDFNHESSNSAREFADALPQFLTSTHTPISSTLQTLSSTSQPASSIPQPLSSTPQPLRSTPQPMSSNHIRISSTPVVLSFAHNPVSSTLHPSNLAPKVSDSTPQSYEPILQGTGTVASINLNHEPLIPGPNSTSSTLERLNSAPRSSGSTLERPNTSHNSTASSPEPLNSTSEPLNSTPEPLNSAPDMLNPTPNSLLSSLELVTTTTHLPSFRASKSSFRDPNRIIQGKSSSPRSQDNTRVSDSRTPDPEGDLQEPLLTIKNSTSISQDNTLGLASRAPDPNRQPIVSVMTLPSASTTPPSAGKRPGGEPILSPAVAAATSSPARAITHRSTHRTRNSSKLHPTKRRTPEISRSLIQRSAPSDLQNIDSEEDPEKNVCKDDPCGPGIPCHPTPRGEKPFECICSNGELRIQPNDTCEDSHIDGIPQPKPMLPPSYGNKNLVGAVVVVSLVMVVVLLLVYWRRKNLYTLLRHRQREKKSGPQSPGSLAKSSSLLTYNFASNPNYYAQSPDNLPLHTLAVQLINPDQISFIGVLGEGCFGKVYKGTYGPRCPRENVGVANDVEEGRRRRGGRGSNADGEAGGGGEAEEEEEEEEEDEEEEAMNTTVAVKVLKECAGVEAEADFRREVEIMSAFKHENILSLIGIVVTEMGGTPWMVFEYMQYGDLAEVLRSCNKQFYSNECPIKYLSKEDLLNISVQIASGMEYLSSQHFVHRDLACRNCLVGKNLTVKISDFGMSRDVYTCDYYKVGGSRLLPVRWMAHESIMYGKFTLESDVWSFAVVLWEIYSFGKQPYYGNPNENVIKLIFQGILLSPPDTCPPQVCDVMRRCWATDPNDRLKFPEILARLKRLQEDQRSAALPSTPPSPRPAVPTPITYSELCLHDEGGLELDSDQYLMPKMAEPREYITVLNDV